MRARGNLSRRGFLERSAVALAATGLPAWSAREALAGGEAKAPKTYGPNDKLRVGAIGTGSRGLSVMEEIARRPGIEIVAICDVDAGHRAKALSKLKGKESEVGQYNDFRELLARDDIDAVTVVTPDHWHALVSIEAAKRGKAIYCEKPLSLTIGEGKAMVRAVRSADVVFQTGSQQRSDARFRLACELVRNNRLGKIHRVITAIGENPKGGPFKPSPVPEGLDWNFWLGPTPEIAYVPESCHYEFRWWYTYSGGKMTDWGAHHNDIAQWGLGMDESGPVSVEGRGIEPTRLPNCYNWHPQFEVKYTYANGVELICKSHPGNGVRFEGEKGWIFVDRSKIEASDQKLLDEPLPQDAVRLDKSDDHMANFVDSVRKHEKPICDVAIGHRSVSVCHIGNIALILKRKLQWDPQAEQFVGDDEANTYLSREMRAPWKLEV